MKVVLELLEKCSNIRCVTIRHDIVIGRGSDCNLRVSAPQVSRRHCFLRISGDRVSITDLESCNGTWLNGQKTVSGKRYFLDDGMQVAVGPVKFIARITASESVADALEVADDVQSMPPDYAAVIPADPLESDSMNFALEHAGDAATEDEPTRDYRAASGSGDSGLIEIRPGSESEQIIEIDEAFVDADNRVIVEVLSDEETIVGQVVEAIEIDDFINNDDVDEVIVLEDD
jgi:pSer/pThr/pTyr-binding forkhead associated (FHA) protein